MHKRTDRLYVTTLGAHELEALRVIEDRPGITVEEPCAAMGVSMQRAWQYVGRLEASSVRRELAGRDCVRVLE